MIFGIGTDLTEISRFSSMTEKRRSDFINTFMHETERAQISKFSYDITKISIYLAKRFAAKEAFFKALGTGIRGKVKLNDISITNDRLGKPIMTVYNETRNSVELILQSSKYNILVSLSDTNDLAAAFVVITVE